MCYYRWEEVQLPVWTGWISRRRPRCDSLTGAFSAMPCPVAPGFSSYECTQRAGRDSLGGRSQGHGCDVLTGVHQNCTSGVLSVLHTREYRSRRKARTSILSDCCVRASGLCVGVYERLQDTQYVERWSGELAAARRSVRPLVTAKQSSSGGGGKQQEGTNGRTERPDTADTTPHDVVVCVYEDAALSARRSKYVEPTTWAATTTTGLLSTSVRRLRGQPPVGYGPSEWAGKQDLLEQQRPADPRLRGPAVGLSSCTGGWVVGDSWRQIGFSLAAIAFEENDNHSPADHLQTVEELQCLKPLVSPTAYISQFDIRLSSHAAVAAAALEVPRQTSSSFYKSPTRRSSVTRYCVTGCCGCSIL